MRKDEILPFATTWMELEGIMPLCFSKTPLSPHFIQDPRIQVTFGLAPLPRKMGSLARCYCFSTLCCFQLPTLLFLWGSRLLLLNHGSFAFHISSLNKFSRDTCLILCPYIYIYYFCPWLFTIFTGNLFILQLPGLSSDLSL